MFWPNLWSSLCAQCRFGEEFARCWGRSPPFQSPQQSEVAHTYQVGFPRATWVEELYWRCHYRKNPTLIERTSPAHICKKKATRMIQSDSNYISMKLNSVIRWCHFFFSLRVFAASLVWPELFKANLVRNNGELTAEEYQHQSSLICVIWVLQVILRLQTFEMQNKENKKGWFTCSWFSAEFELCTVVCLLTRRHRMLL